MTVTAAPPLRGLARSQDGTEIAYATLGAGPGLLVLGGAWRAARDYLPFARALAPAFEVHVIDRRGRGRSGPQGSDYGIERELEDLRAVQGQTGATVVFGHSYGGLVALEAARRSSAWSDVIAYEPGVSLGGSIPSGWMALYRERLAAGDPRGAFAAMVRGSGAAPRALTSMPLWYVKLVLRLFIRDQQWREMELLMPASLAEHEQVIALDADTADRFHTITARVLLLGGSKSPAFLTGRLFDELTTAIRNCTAEVIKGLDHVAPDEKAPAIIADRVRRHLQAVN
jgi:pimeloyl-ACP methyl ester carboxylesterase